MNACIQNETLTFLKDLQNNNNKDWFESNKMRYEAAKLNFEDFINQLIKEIAKFEPSLGHFSGKECIFRIYRDVRFSKDKSPYKINFGAHISAVAKKSDIHSRAGYYFHLEPQGKTMLGGGAYLPAAEWLKNIRQEIDFNGKSLIEILENPDFRKYFGSISGEKLKRSPKGFDDNHPQLELLKMKSFVAMHTVEDKEITSPDFLNHAIQVYKALKPLDDFLNIN